MTTPRLAPRLAGLVAAAFAVTGVAVTSVPASAVPTPAGRLTLTAATQAMTSSTGTPLRLGLSAGAGDLSVTVWRSNEPEHHTWAFPFPDASDISFDAETGHGALTSGTAIEPYGRVSLALKQIGKSSIIGCGRTRSELLPVAITGTIYFRTHSAWGAVGGSSRRSFTGRSRLTIFDPADKLCPSTLPRCVVASTWEAHNIASDLRGFTQFIGTTSKAGSSTTSNLRATRLTYLAKPAGATRTDVSSTKISRPTFTFAGSNATVRVRSSGAHVTGTARLVGGRVNPQTPLACGDAQHRTMRTDWLASYSNGAHPLVVHEQIAGNLRLVNVKGESNRANATIDRTLSSSA
jgi:hypothetical protein